MSAGGIDVAWPQGARYNSAQWAGKIAFAAAKATEAEATEGAAFIDPAARAVGEQNIAATQARLIGQG
jgi:hypothetical protein